MAALGSPSGRGSPAAVFTGVVLAAKILREFWNSFSNAFFGLCGAAFDWGGELQDRRWARRVGSWGVLDRDFGGEHRERTGSGFECDSGLIWDRCLRDISGIGARFRAATASGDVTIVPGPT